MRLRYIVLIVVAILVAPFLAFWAWSAVEAKRLDRAFAALEARNEPLDIAAFDPTPSTDEQKQASHDYAQASKLVADVMPRWVSAAGKMIEEFCGSADPVTHQGRAASLKSLEDRYARALELLDRAAALDAHGWDPRDRPATNSLEEIFAYHVAHVNAARIARLACSGQPDPGAQALLASLRLRRVVVGTGFLVNVRVGHSLQLVLAARPSLPLVAKLQQEFEALAAEPRLQRDVRWSRAYWLYFFEPGTFSDPPPGQAVSRLTPFQAVAMRLSRPWRDHLAVAELREYDEVMAAASRPWPQVLDAAATLEKKYPRRPNRGNLVSAVAGVLGVHAANSRFQFLIGPVTESVARVRACIGALAVARWRVDHAGALPASLHEIVPSYSSTPLLDPYTGQELKYVKSGNSYKVYSVGANRRDDGGTWEQTSDLQQSRRGNPLDIGIAVNQN